MSRLYVACSNYPASFLRCNYLKVHGSDMLATTNNRVSLWRWFNWENLFWTR